MALDISPKTHARLISKAREKGVSIDALLERLLNEADVLSASSVSDKSLELPAWHLGLRGNLHRRDVYDWPD
jgi:hypothetical protein